MINFRKKLKTIVKIILLLIVGFSVGVFTRPLFNVPIYKLGLASFCKLNEDDRFKICPTFRFSSNIKEGGSLTLYMCDERHAYLETNNVSKNFKNLEEFLDRYKIASECQTKYGTIYELIFNE